MPPKIDAHTAFFLRANPGYLAGELVRAQLALRSYAAPPCTGWRALAPNAAARYLAQCAALGSMVTRVVRLVLRTTTEATVRPPRRPLTSDGLLMEVLLRPSRLDDGDVGHVWGSVATADGARRLWPKSQRCAAGTVDDCRSAPAAALAARTSAARFRVPPELAVVVFGGLVLRFSIVQPPMRRRVQRVSPSRLHAQRGHAPRRRPDNATSRRRCSPMLSPAWNR